ncbi:NAD(+) synthetase [Stygiolobus caldivivus]|uniref:NH(3)-dependent NAD(+) synthetase n=2 Tax=Stygiolobus caldivivus TaxID=2824673 RepID=A0A8D5U557_9CREN|nr:NAD(+) synthetase [Stygiolobus caldivivus]
MMPEYVRKKLISINYDQIIEYITKRIREYIEESGKEGGIVGLSGGIDSSVTAILLSKATPKTYFLLMPSKSTPLKDIEHAYQILKLIKARDDQYSLVNIDNLTEEFSRLINTDDKLIIGNIKARIRMVLLYAYAQKRNYLVIGTGDKSELMLGYFTKYGDGGVDILPIGDLYKSQVRALGSYLGVPKEIVDKPPSPGLWEGQTAEGEIGVDYETIDSILYLKFEEMFDEGDISKMTGTELPTVKKIIKMVKVSQHKRLPPEIFRISGRAINSDWRYPRQWG